MLPEAGRISRGRATRRVTGPPKGVNRAAGQSRSSRTTTSMCAVCGNMSIGWTATMR